MKILVVPRRFMEQNHDVMLTEQIISIFSTKAASDKPFSPFFGKRDNILKLQFDDVEAPISDIPSLILFNEELANKIKEWIEQLDTEKQLFIHCDAGISRSGAVGDVLNQYFNKYLKDNKEDFEFFEQENNQIFPNHLVKRILWNVLFK